MQRKPTAKVGHLKHTVGWLVFPSLQALADAFRINQTVAVLNLSNNQIGDEGFKVICVGTWEVLEGCREHHGWSKFGLTSECLKHAKNKICFFDQIL